MKTALNLLIAAATLLLAVKNVQSNAVFAPDHNPDLGAHIEHYYNDKDITLETAQAARAMEDSEEKAGIPRPTAANRPRRKVDPDVQPVIPSDVEVPAIGGPVVEALLPPPVTIQTPPAPPLTQTNGSQVEKIPPPALTSQPSSPPPVQGPTNRVQAQLPATTSLVPVKPPVIIKAPEDSQTVDPTTLTQNGTFIAVGGPPGTKGPVWRRVSTQTK